MVDTTETQDLKQIELELQTLFFKVVDERQTFPKVVEEPNMTIYQTVQDDGKTNIVTEVPLVEGVLPDEFKYFIENWAVAAKEINPMLDSITELEPVQGYKVSRSVANAPWPLSNRVVYAARYPCIDYKPNEHVYVMSERGAESRMIWTEQDEKDFALGKVFVAGWSFQPVSDSEGTCTGTRIYYLACADAGGNIPAAM